MESEESFTQEVDEKESFLQQNSTRRFLNDHHGQQKLWIVVTAILSILCVLLSIYAAILKAALQEQRSTFATGYDTELGMFTRTS